MTKRVVRNCIADWLLFAKAVHFIDSGDFHYLTEYWVSRIHEPFSLIVFRPSSGYAATGMGGVVSCGGWVRDVLEKNPFVKHIIIVGASDELIALPVHLRRGCCSTVRQR